MALRVPKMPFEGGHLLGVGAIGVMSAMDYKRRVKEGQNPLVAALVAGGQGYIGLTMGAIPGMLVLQAPMLVKTAADAYYSHYRGHSAFRRRAVTAFSHSYQHTDATLQMQQMGLNSINKSRGSAGAEAGIFAQAYGRR
jgi:hypothetical protein